MHNIKNLARLGVVLATLGVIALAFAGRASAATAVIPDPGAAGGGETVPAPAVQPMVHTVVVGGMPGWQIAAIAVVAALVAATAAVLVSRTRSIKAA